MFGPPKGIVTWCLQVQTPTQKVIIGKTRERESTKQNSNLNKPWVWRVRNLQKTRFPPFFWSEILLGESLQQNEDQPPNWTIRYLNMTNILCSQTLTYSMYGISTYIYHKFKWNVGMKIPYMEHVGLDISVFLGPIEIYQTNPMPELVVHLEGRGLCWTIKDVRSKFCSGQLRRPCWPKMAENSKSLFQIFHF